MGNDLSLNTPAKDQSLDFTDFLKERKKRQSEHVDHNDKYAFSPELRWRNELLSVLEAQRKNKKYEELCNDMQEVVKKIKMENFIKAISMLTAVNSQDVYELTSKQVFKESFNFENVRQSEHVVIDFGPRFKNASDSVSTEYSANGSPQKAKSKKSQQQAKKTATLILVKQFNQPYHPNKILKQSFIMIFQMKYRFMLNQIGPLNQQKREDLCNKMHQDLKFYCNFVASGSSIYKKWVLKSSKVREDRYLSFMQSIIMDSLFTGQSLHSSIFPILKQISEEPVNKMLPNIRDNMGIECFHVNKQLQIEGNFVLSLMTLGDMDRLSSPRKILDMLESLKQQICLDIDQYHQLFKTDKNYKIDGDNLLGILCFLLCRMKPKMLEMYAQILLLVVVYGETTVNTMFQSASYMVTSFQASFDHFASNDFLLQSPQ